MNTTQSFSKLLQSYNILIILIVAFIILMIPLVIRSPNSFNVTFGKQILFTTPMLFILVLLIKDFFISKQNINNSTLFKMFNMSPGKILAAILFFGIFTFLMLLYFGGIFSDNPPENNVATTINVIIIILFIAAAAKIYDVYAKKDEQTLNSMSIPKNIRDAIKFRTKYTFIFALFGVAIALLYFLNPFGIMTKYGSPFIFFTLLVVGVPLIFLINRYNTFLGDPTKDNDMTRELPGFNRVLLKGISVIGILLIAVLLIWSALKLFGVFDFDATVTGSWTSLIFNLIVLSVTLGIIYRSLNVNEMLENNHYLRLFVNTLMYIPCLLVYLLYYVTKLLPTFKGSQGSQSQGSQGSQGSQDFSKGFKEFTTTPPKPFEMKMLVTSLILLGGYFTWTLFGNAYATSYYLKQGGKVLINEPVPIDKLTNVTSYQELTGSERYDYRYALSFWFYLDAFPPSTNSSYNKMVSLLSYGGNPSVNYISETNTLYITVKETNPKSDSENADDNKEMTPENQMKFAENKINDSVKSSVKDAIEKVKLLTFGKDLDSEGNRIIYKHPNVQLQKWNHVLLNYNGGTLDVFYNGKLVKTAIEVVPYMKNDMLTVGTENGVSGNIANLSYFDKPLDIKTIDTLYVELKDKTVPSLPKK